MLDEMPAARDREVLVRFYLNDEEKDRICQELHLSHEHFNRVIFRARNRFRALLEQRGLWKSDLLTIVAIGLGICGAGYGTFGSAAHGAGHDAGRDHTAISGGVK
jgi:hypothetical protein